MPLPEVVDESILKCPIDTRRGLYKVRLRETCVAPTPPC